MQGKAAKVNGKPEKPVELSEEDKKLEEDLEMLMQRLCETDTSLHLPALETMRTLIRASTTSMTSVPKPLKFMRPHYSKIKELFERMSEGDAKKLCADIISVLAMCSDQENDCINYRIKGTQQPIENWGHEYVRHLCMETVSEWNRSADNKTRRDELLTLVREVVTHNVKHNAEVEACDLLIEIGELSMLLDYVNDLDHVRVCLYLLSCAPLKSTSESRDLLVCAKDIYLKSGKPFEALRCAIILRDMDLIRSIFNNCTDGLVRKQMAILLGRHQIYLETGDSQLQQLNSNLNFHHHFRALIRELDLMEPKKPEDIYKSHLEQSDPFTRPSVDSSRMNLAYSLVNGFVNCGFCGDKVLVDAEGAKKWFAKNKEFATLSAAASLGLIHRWDIDRGLTACDQFLNSENEYIRAGTMLAIGVISSGVQDPVDPSSAILMDHLRSDKVTMRIGSIFGLGIAYANSTRDAVIKKEDGGVVHELKKIFSDKGPAANAEVKGVAGLALGLILVGSANHEVAGEMIHYLMDSCATSDHNHRFVALGIALIFLGTQDRSEVFIESVRALPEPLGGMTSTLIDVCAYAGTGNVTKMQELLRICSEHPKQDDKSAEGSPAGSLSRTPTGSPMNSVKEDESDAKEAVKVDHTARQSVAVLGLGLIAMGEEIGCQMSIRTFGHLVRYGEKAVRRAVPLAYALISASNPQLNVIEILSKYSHDADMETARNAIFALGIVGAGTNNARVVTMLRQLAGYQAKDPIAMMLVRISQGLTHLGKGTMSLNPFHSDRQLMCPAVVASIFSTCFAFLDAENSILSSRQHYLFYNLAVGIQPRLLITLMENEQKKLKQVNVSVRVGQAVDVVAQVGRPKTITGFQTHSTPVLLSFGERAELASEEYIACTPIIEGLVVVKKNADWDANDKQNKKK